MWNRYAPADPGRTQRLTRRERIADSLGIEAAPGTQRRRRISQCVRLIVKVYVHRNGGWGDYFAQTHLLHLPDRAS